MSRINLVGATILAAVLLLPACGDDDVVDGGTTTAPSGNGGTTEAPGDGDMADADFPPAADPGTGFLEIDGMTFTGEAEACTIEASGAQFRVVAVSGDMEVEFGGQLFGTGGVVDVNIDGEQMYHSTTENAIVEPELWAEAAIEGSTLFWAGPFSIQPNFVPTGETVEGRMSVTC